MSETITKCENNENFKQNCFLNFLNTFKMSNPCCFSLGVILDIIDFLQKRFYNMDYLLVRSIKVCQLVGSVWSPERS